MDINLLFKILTVFNVLVLLFSLFLIYKFKDIKSKLIKTCLFSIAVVYVSGFIYIEMYFIQLSFIDESDIVALIVVTVSTHMLSFLLYTIRKLDNYFSLEKEKINDNFYELISSKYIYSKVIKGKIDLGIPFNIIKVKFINHRKLIDISSEKLFRKVMSYSVLMLKKD